MLREFCLLTLLTLGLALAAEACGTPAGEVAPDSPAAQATTVRRTAVAEVQRIIANNATATPAPAATPVPGPTCPNAIWWTEARSHFGESRSVQGTVVGVRPAPEGASLLEIGQPYPDPDGLVVVVASGTLPDLSGKSVCVAGRIIKLEGVPAMQLRDSSSIVAVSAGKQP